MKLGHVFTQLRAPKHLAPQREVREAMKESSEDYSFKEDILKLVDSPLVSLAKNVVEE